MAIIEHKEYKVICDNCGSDVTLYIVAENKTDALKQHRFETGLPLKRGSQFCEECRESDNLESRKKDIDIEGAIQFFETAKPVHFKDINK